MTAWYYTLCSATLSHSPHESHSPPPPPPPPPSYRALQVDREWYDEEEGGAAHNADGHSRFVGDESFFQKREQQLTQRVVLRNGQK